MPVGPEDWPLDQGLDAALLVSAAGAFPDSHPIAVAVSGGGDSMALLHLLHRAAAQKGGAVSAVTVNHDLRPEAAAEAEGVARFCAALAIPHQTLVWDHGEISGNLMDQARQARSRLIADWAKGQGISNIALGHTADDEAESFLMALARSSGVDGLAGMRRFWRESGLWWSRPLLTHSRAELRTYLRRNGIVWVDDPTNEDMRYTRAKARKALATLAHLGITAPGISRSITHLKLAQSALQEALAAFVKAHVQQVAGALAIPRVTFERLHMELQRRLLSAAITWMSGAEHPTRGTKQVQLLFAVKAGKDATLGGCRVRVSADMIRVSRELKAVTALKCPTDKLWDNRWHVSGPHDPDFEVRALGSAGLLTCKGWRDTGIPRDALIVSPAIWRGDTLISAPLAGFPQGWTAQLPAGFAKFILSH